MSKLPRIEEYSHPAGGWGSLKAVATILLREQVALHGARMLMHQNKPDGYRVRQLRLGQAGRAASVRILRERRQGDGLGDHRQARDARVLRSSTRSTELETLARPRPRGGRAADRADALGRRHRQISCRSAGSEAFAEIGARAARLDPKRVVFYTSGRASLETSLHVPAVRAHVRHATTCRTARTCATRARRWRCRRAIGVPVGTVIARRLRADRLHLLLRPERRHEQPAHAASAAGRAQARRADHHLQSAARARAGAASPIRSRRARC